MFTGIVFPDKSDPLGTKLVGGFVVLLIGFSDKEFKETVTGILGFGKFVTEFKLPVIMGLARDNNEAE